MRSENLRVLGLQANGGTGNRVVVRVSHDPLQRRHLGRCRFCLKLLLLNELAMNHRRSKKRAQRNDAGCVDIEADHNVSANQKSKQNLFLRV